MKNIDKKTIETILLIRMEINNKICNLIINNLIRKFANVTIPFNKESLKQNINN